MIVCYEGVKGYHYLIDFFVRIPRHKLSVFFLQRNKDERVFQGILASSQCVVTVVKGSCKIQGAIWVSQYCVLPITQWSFHGSKLFSIAYRVSSTVFLNFILDKIRER